MASTSDVTIIIPTLCSDSRAESLLRAIYSVRASSTESVQIIVVVNGQRVSPAVYAAVSKTGVILLRQEEGSLPKALALGRSQVRTPFFGFLDDDDEMLMGGLDLRLSVLRADSRAAVVVSNGYREEGGELSPMNPDMQGIEEDPLRSLLERNWLASCAGLYRTALVHEGYFAKPHRFAEWTWLGFQLCAAGLRFRTIETKGYVVHDTPQSLSKAGGYYASYVSLFDRMLSCNLPPWARLRIQQKRSDALHHLSVRSLSNGVILEAAKLHFQSLFPLTHGLRYILYGRHIGFRALCRWLRLPPRG